MKEARLGRWNLSVGFGITEAYFQVEMKEARLGRWNVHWNMIVSDLLPNTSSVEMKEARLGRWNNISFVPLSYDCWLRRNVGFDIHSVKC